MVNHCVSTFIIVQFQNLHKENQGITKEDAVALWARQSEELEKPAQEASASGGLRFYDPVLVHKAPAPTSLVQGCRRCDVFFIGS